MRYTTRISRRAVAASLVLSAALASCKADSLLKSDNPDASDPRIGEMYAISALVHVSLGEDYCSGVPFSTTAPELTYGDPQTTTQIYQRAIARLDLAKQNSFGSATVTNLEAVLRGRTLVD